ncbi:MAG: hypothetical protein ACK4QW_04815 [Alphaproteobacteria bacterium]
MHDDEIMALAKSVGLETAATRFRGDLEKAVTFSRKLKDEMPRDFGLAEEPAHVLRLKAEG